MRDFRTLTVWRQAHGLVLDVYALARRFPADELYGLTSQIRRSASSVPTNIAEGCGSDGGQEFARFLQIAMRSASELDYQLLLARDLGYIDQQTYAPVERRLAEAKRILNALIRKVRQDVRMQQQTSKSGLKAQDLANS